MKNCSHIMVFVVAIAAVLFERSVIDVDSFVFRRRACWTHSDSRQSIDMLHRYSSWYDCDRIPRRSVLGMLRYQENTDTVSAHDDGVAVEYDSSYSSLYVLPNSPVSLSSTVGFLQHWGREQADTGSAITAEVWSQGTMSCGS